MAVAASSTIAVLPFGKAIVGLAIGATARPQIARMLNKRPIVERLIMAFRIPVGVCFDTRGQTT
jgi:hypothetical protein